MPALAGAVQAIGLTGGIGSGKSTVAALLVAHGAILVDTDAIAHAMTASGGPAMAALRLRFGDDVANADGALDRARMRWQRARQWLDSVNSGTSNTTTPSPVVSAAVAWRWASAPIIGCRMASSARLASGSANTRLRILARSR